MEISRFLYETGSLSWEAGPLAKALESVAMNADAVRWTTPPEIMHLLARLRGAKQLNTTTTSGPALEGVEYIFEV